MKSLHREFDAFCSNIQDTHWYRTVQDMLSFEDWIYVDAIYRSRALEFPGIGHCMVPCLDIANHAAGDATIALYEKDEEGNAVLLLRPNKHVKQGDEITITYGDDKGACEMLFSYGFLDDDVSSARAVFLSLDIPEGDPTRIIRLEIADCAPGFKIDDISGGKLTWTGDFVWMLCVNSCDGLQFKLARTTDGDEEIQGFFQDTRITSGASQLHSLLQQSDLWDVYQLRAVTILHERVASQLESLASSQEVAEDDYRACVVELRDHQYRMAMRLRARELRLLSSAYEYFENQVRLPYS